MNSNKKVEIIDRVETSKSLEIKNMMKQILPDNRPITGFQIVEDLDKCPKNFQAISRTHDSDGDADLWRASGGLFARKPSRYLCLAKTDGQSDYVVDNISVVGEKDRHLDGYTFVPQTSDTKQKAWRKKQLCYRLVPSVHAKHVVTDVILCSRSKRPPDGFSLAGEINGILVCFKTRDMSLPPTVPLRSPPVPPKPAQLKEAFYAGVRTT